VADRDLFGAYEGCLNLGGFANISIKHDADIQAFDICPCNTLLNDIANELGLAFDDGGQLAAAGKVIPEMLSALNNLPLYAQEGQKPSLSRETIDTHFTPV
jgi:anhydro-N-acetylmuramic acid kinase